MFTLRLQQWVRQLPPNASVLDVGCGTGKTINWLAEERPDVSITALDILDMRPSLDGRVMFFQGSVEQLVSLFDADSFDAVICQHVIEHLHQPFNLMDGVRKVLKPGGTLFIETPNWPRLFIPFHQDFFWNDYSHVHPYSKTSLHRLLKDFDFSVDCIMSISSMPLWSMRGLRSSERRSPLLLPWQILKKIPNALLFDVLICIGSKS